MKKYGVIGYKGKIGSLLVKRADFVPVDCDITDKQSIYKGLQGVEAFWRGKLDVIVNCAAISSIDECEQNVHKAYSVNVLGWSNLHDVFGDRIVNIGTDQVFGDNWLFAPKENSERSPVNIYGMTKVAAEGLEVGKTLRLSRTVSILDPDVHEYLFMLQGSLRTEIPHLFLRNFLTRSQAVDGIETFVRCFNTMPKVLNYGSTSRFRMTDIIIGMCKVLGLDYGLITKRRKNLDTFTPRPVHGGLSTKLASRLGFIMYDKGSVISGLLDELNGH